MSAPVLLDPGFRGLDIEALRNASERRRMQVVAGLRDRGEEVLAMRDQLVADVERDRVPKIARGTTSPWLAIAGATGEVHWHRRVTTLDVPPVLDVMVEVIAALHGDRVIDPSTGPITPPGL